MQIVFQKAIFFSQKCSFRYGHLEVWRGIGVYTDEADVLVIYRGSGYMNFLLPLCFLAKRNLIMLNECPMSAWVAIHGMQYTRIMYVWIGKKGILVMFSFQLAYVEDVYPL